jgi:antitoxin PrlF
MNGTPANKQPRPRAVSARARLRAKSQITLPEEIRLALRVNEGDEIEFMVREDGTVTVRGYISVPTDHAWLYAPQQSTSRTSDSGLIDRQATVHESADEMLSYLDGLGAADA